MRELSSDRLDVVMLKHSCEVDRLVSCVELLLNDVLVRLFVAVRDVILQFI